MMIKKLLIEALKIEVIAGILWALIKLISWNHILGFTIIAILGFLIIVISILLNYGRKHIQDNEHRNKQEDKQIIQNFKTSKIMEGKIYFVDGVDKTLDVYENKIVLTSKKVRTAVFWVLLFIFTFTTYVIGGIIFWLVWDSANGKEKTIYIKNLKSIELKKPGTMLNGIMQFNLDDSTNRGSTYGSENSIAFSGDSNYELCCTIRDFIESKL